MFEWFQQLLQHLSNHQLMQMLLAAFASLFLEDPTTMACGLLVADRQMHFYTAYFSIVSGIAFGDFVLYWLGRSLGPKTVQWKLVPPDRLDRVRGWFNRNLIMTVLVARFIPGMRLPTYVGAGIFRASAIYFLGLALAASSLWVFGLLWLTSRLGLAIFPVLGRYRWPVAVLLLVLFWGAQWMLARRHARQMTEAQKRERADYQSPVSLFEFWPKWLFYIPVALDYAWLSIRRMGPTLPTAVNPAIYAGGLLGNAKSELLKLAPDEFKSRVAPWARFDPPDPPAPPHELLAMAHQAMARSGLTFPIVAKPDIGHHGAGVKPVRNDEQLRQYLEAFPSGMPLLLQQLIDLPGEAGIVYCRRPNEERGRIFSLALKEFPSVTGDGKSKLRALIMRDERAAIIHDIYFRRHQHQLERVLAEGEVFPLVFTGNHRQGAVLRNGNGLVTPALTAAIEAIARGIPEFYYGRFEVRYQSQEDLLRGESFIIIEINGAGAEALHIWDCRTTLGEAYRTLFQQWAILFEIGAMNRRRGCRALGWRALIREARAYFRPLRRYPTAQ